MVDFVIKKKKLETWINIFFHKKNKQNSQWTDIEFNIIIYFYFFAIKNKFMSLQTRIVVEKKFDPILVKKLLSWFEWQQTYFLNFL